MIKRLKKVLKCITSPAGKISIVLLFISAACYTWPCLTNNGDENLKNFLLGLCTNFLGIIVTVTFVQSIIDKQNIKNEKDDEKEEILRHHRIMQVLIERYLMYYDCVVTPISERIKAPCYILDRDFQFEDMYDMYNQTLYVSERHYEPSIVLLYKAEEELRNYITSVIENVEFKYNETLLTVLLEFVKKSIVYDMRGAVLGNITLISGKKKMTETISEYIKDPSYKWVEEFDNDKLSNNIMTPYVILYKLLKDEKLLLIQYIEYIDDLVKSRTFAK